MHLGPVVQISVAVRRVKKRMVGAQVQAGKLPTSVKGPGAAKVSHHFLRCYKKTGCIVAPQMQ